MNLEALLAAIERGAVAAAQVTRRVQSEATLRGDALSKSGDEPVTIADYASQALILRDVAAAFPKVRIVSEEASEHLRNQQSDAVLDRVRALVADAVGEAVGRERLCAWIDHAGDAASDVALTIDPIDGTKGFLRREHYAIAIGILARGRPVGGVLVCPRLAAREGAPHQGAPREGVVITALEGCGAFERPLDARPGDAARRIAVSSSVEASGVRVLESVESSHGNPKLVDDLIAALGLSPHKVRIDSQVKYAVLARGEAEVYLRPQSKPTYRDYVWDHAGGTAIALEAGARVTDQDGRPLDFSKGRRLEDNRGVLATHGPMHDAIVAALRRIERGSKRDG